MGTIYDKDNIKLSLFDRSQHHGHNISHIHANDHGERLWFDAEGNICEGKSKNSKAILKWIRSHQSEIKKRLKLLAEGKEITTIDGDIV